jgi:tetratricopeptide (TPR) repeat protein
MFAHVGAGILSLLKGELSQATSALERGFNFCRTWNLPILFPVTASSLGTAYALAGRAAEAIPLLEQALAQATSMKLMTGRSLFVGRLGEACLLAGRMNDAIRHAERALSLARDQKERGHEAYALRLLAEIALRGDPPDFSTADTYCQQAMELARELGMRPLLGHANLGLGSLYRRTGRASDAERTLTLATALFREMGMRFWLEKAEAELSRCQRIT